MKHRTPDTIKIFALFWIFINSSSSSAISTYQELWSAYSKTAEQALFYTKRVRLLIFKNITCLQRLMSRQNPKTCYVIRFWKRLLKTVSGFQMACPFFFDKNNNPWYFWCTCKKSLICFSWLSKNFDCFASWACEIPQS